MHPNYNIIVYLSKTSFLPVSKLGIFNTYNKCLLAKLQQDYLIIAFPCVVSLQDLEIQDVTGIVWFKININ